jgi:nucleoside-diphosphate-sugar epimerase
LLEIMLVVTGASGFLGAAIVHQAATSGLAVAAASRRPLAAMPGVVVIQVDDYATLAPPGRDATLIHLAETADIGSVAADEVDYVERVRGAFASLAARGWRHVVYASSAAVYDDQIASPRREDEEIAPRHLYTAAKLAGEAVTIAVRGCALRLGNVYGPGMSRRVVISDILEQLPGREAIRVRDLAPVRDFIAVEDAAEGVLLAARRRLSGVYNLATGTGTSVKRLADIVLRLSGQESRAVVETAPAGRPSHIVLDMQRTQHATGWRPATSIESGLGRLIDEAR